MDEKMLIHIYKLINLLESPIFVCTNYLIFDYLNKIAFYL